MAEGKAEPATVNLIDVLEQLPEPIPGPPTQEVLDALRQERL